MNSNIDELIISVISKHREVTRAIVFGSRARHDNNPRSDIDLAIACPGASNERWAEIENDIQQIDT